MGWLTETFACHDWGSKGRWMLEKLRFAKDAFSWWFHRPASVGGQMFGHRKIVKAVNKDSYSYFILEGVNLNVLFRAISIALEIASLSMYIDFLDLHQVKGQEHSHPTQNRPF